MMYVVLFNHQAERASYLIAFTGATLWFCGEPRENWRSALYGIVLFTIPVISTLVPGAVFRHGPVKRTLHGNELGYYAEFEFADSDAFKAAAAGEEFAATGKDAAELGVPHSVHVAHVDG